MVLIHLSDVFRMSSDPTVDREKDPGADNGDNDENQRQRAIVQIISEPSLNSDCDENVVDQGKGEQAEGGHKEDYL